MKATMDILKMIFKLGGDDMLVRQAKLMTLGKPVGSEVAELLSGMGPVSKICNKAIDEAFDTLQIKGAFKSADALNNVVDASPNRVAAAIEEAITEVKPSTGRVDVPRTMRVKPEKVLDGTEGKIARIKERMQGLVDDYNVKNKSYRGKQEVAVKKFQAYVDDYASKRSELTVKLENATSIDERKVIAKEIEKLDNKAEKAIRKKLEDVGTLTSDEITQKAKEVRNYIDIKNSNAVYANVGDGAKTLRDEAEKLIEEVSKEFQSNNYTKKMTPEQLRYIVNRRLQTIESLLRKNQFEDKLTAKGNIKINGMPLEVEIPILGTKAGEEIAKYGKGTPEETLKYYKALKSKIDKACKNLQMAERQETNGYQQIIERKVEVPIRDMEKSKELKFLENQLEAKQTQLKAEKFSRNEFMAKS